MKWLAFGAADGYVMFIRFRDDALEGAGDRLKRLFSPYVGFKNENWALSCLFGVSRPAISASARDR